MSKSNGVVNEDCEEAMPINEESKPRFKKSYELPTLRYSNLVILLVTIDTIISIALWVTGGNTDYFTDNIKDFHLTESVFDLALLSAGKMIFFVGFLSLLETYSYRQIEKPYDNSLNQKTKIIHILLVVVSFFTFGYTVTKGGLVLNKFLNDSSYSKIHSKYNGLVISAVCFSFIEFIAPLLSFGAMRRLKVIGILHRYNDNGVEVDKEGKVIQKKVNIKRLIVLAKPEWVIILWGTLALVASSGSQMAAPLFFGMVVDAAQKDLSELTRLVIILLIIYMIGAIFAFLRSWMFTLAGQRFVARLRKKLFAQIIEQDVAFFDTNRTGELCNRLASDTQVLQNAATVNISMLVRYILQLIGSLVFMFVLNAALTGVLLSVVPLVSIVAVQYGKFVQKMQKKFQDKLGDAGTVAEESLSGVRTVRSFSAEPKTVHNYGKEINESYRIGKQLALASGGFQGIIGVLAQGAIALVLWYGGKLVYDEAHGKHTGLTPGVLTSFLLYTLQVAMAFAFMSSLYGDFMKAVGASVRIFGLLERKPEVPNENGLIPAELTGRVEFKNVTFTYPSRPETEVLKNITFTVEPGEMVALVGPSGGGKSTIVNLIERFYDPNGGTIYLDDYDLKELDPQWFRKKISMVSQEPTLFACSIKENIAFGINAELSEIEDVCKQANAHDFIQTFEERYDTLVGERGVRLSGGQKQRIAIARALIMNPKLLLLDEATSALDAESEHLVQEAIDRAMKSRTVIVIAHRLSTVRNASKVIVIDKGTIAESGTHDELIAKDGVYKKLVLRQLTAGGRSDLSIQSSMNDNGS
uniref:Putative ATP-binding cassette, sub-family B, member 10 n=1 Tax=Brachidontes pharaonis TaxID=205971 RepID=Q4VYA3_BRAPA|nr:putative ATP-binding cassette, sub-family B, member 10 [Brachidontes pharaonis]